MSSPDEAAMPLTVMLFDTPIFVALFPARSTLDSVIIPLAVTLLGTVVASYASMSNIAEASADKGSESL